MKRRDVILLLLGIGIALATRRIGAGGLPPRALSAKATSAGAVARLQNTPTAFLYLPHVTRNRCTPTLAFTHVPPYGSYDNLQGQAACISPADYRVAVYIRTEGWWNKPYWAHPLTALQNDGGWSADITTGEGDHLAVEIAAFLLPREYTPPLLAGDPTLPAELFTHAVGYALTARYTFRTLEFSGYTWQAKASATPVGPGPNYFSDKESEVWVDEQGRLHLGLSYQDGAWYAAEVFTSEPLGYGSYTFTLASRVDQLDPNVVLGLFTWDNATPEYHYRELDIEFSRWGDAGGDNAQYVVQPWERAGNLHRFTMTLQGDKSTHRFDWRNASVHFASYQGHAPHLGAEIANWRYTDADVPPAGAGNARLNLWLMNGVPPTDGQPVEVIIAAFEFTAAP